MKSRPFVALYYMFLLLCTACKTTATQTVVLSDTTCSPPCWRNIKPGLTTEDELINLLHSMPDIKTGTQESRGQPWLIFNDITSFSLISGEEVNVYFVEGKVTLIAFVRTPGLSTFGKSIEKFGQPQYLTHIGMFGPGPTLSSIIHNYYFVIYPEQGIRFGYDDVDIPKTLRAEIRPDLAISEIDFFDPVSYDALLEASAFSQGLFNARETRKVLQPWRGYGPIETKYPLIPIN